MERGAEDSPKVDGILREDGISIHKSGIRWENTRLATERVRRMASVR